MRSTPLSTRTGAGWASAVAVVFRWLFLIVLGRGCPRATSKDALDQIIARSGLEFDPAIIEALGRAVRENTFEVGLPNVALPATPAAPAAATA